MTDATKPRPDSPCGPGEVWEREHDGNLFVTYDVWGGLHWRRLDSIHGPLPISELCTDRYRKRTLDPLPWPAETKIEERRLVIRFDGTWFTPNDKDFYIGTNPVCDEIRRCEIDEAGRVVRVLPLESE